MKTTLLHRWRVNFIAGLAVALPVLITLAIVAWLFGSVANFTDQLLFFLPRELTHADDGRGPMHWYWSVVAIGLAIGIVTVIGRSARNYFGRRAIEWMDTGLARLPLINKIYPIIKQVQETLTSDKKNAFKTVVLVEFPSPGMRSIGFITSEQHAEVQARTNEHVICVFVPTTPNPTTGFLILVTEDKLIRLDMSVTDGIKYLISVGSVVPQWPKPEGTPPTGP
jgi:uncharacterized membrane protein